jgi:phosphoribosyl 1,2-cyclic phosphodiesterase
VTLRFTVLASGSAGNASLIETDGFGLLLDAGIGPRVLAGRLSAAGLNPQSIHACILTHTHTDHWHDRTFAQFHRRNIPVYCHAEHHDELLNGSAGFGMLYDGGMVHLYASGQELLFGARLHCRPLPLRHDSSATFGFRFESITELYGPTAAIGYAADLGCWSEELLTALLDVDLLALEFNHDVLMEKQSNRHPRLIARVLSDDGHLSNDQAAKLLCEILRRSTPGRLRHLVQLHLSRDCNRPALAQRAARAVVDGHEGMIKIHTSSQHEAGPTLQLTGTATRRQNRLAPMKKAVSKQVGAQLWLPGLETA